MLNQKQFYLLDPVFRMRNKILDDLHSFPVQFRGLKTTLPWFWLRKFHLFLTLPLLIEKLNNTLGFQPLGGSFLLLGLLQHTP